MSALEHGRDGCRCSACVPSSDVRHAPSCGCRRCAPVGECDGCQTTHPASYSHEGSYGEGAVYEVPCPVDGFSTFVTVEGLVS